MATAELTAPAVAVPRGRRAVAPRTVLLVASLGVFMAFVDNTIVSIAFPNMLASFPGATLGDLSWVFNVYNIVIAALLIPAGRFADLVGRRRMFAGGVLLFVAASAACAAAPTVGVLIAARALQGAGSAIIIPASLALILAAYPESRRNQAVAMWTATGALAAGIGPSIGGLLVELSNWRLVFLINLPVGVVVWRLAARQLVESRAAGRRTLPDMPGAALLGVAIATATLAIIESDPWGWVSAKTIGALVVSGILLVLFVRRCRTQATPIVDLELLANRQFAVSGLLTLIGGAGFFAVGLANILYLIDVWGYSPLTAGLAGTPAPFLAAIAAVGAGRLVADRDPRPWLVVGALIWAAGPLILIARFSTEPHYLTNYLPGAAVLAIGIGIAFPLVSAIAVSNAPGSRFAGATALNSSIRQMGAALGVAILVALVGQPSPAQVESAFDSAWVFAAICFGIVAVGSLALGHVRAVETPESLLGGVEDLVREGRRTQDEPLPIPPRERLDVDDQRPPVPETTEEFLAAVPLFAGLDPAARAALAARTTTVSVPAGDWLFREGDAADALYLLRSGRLEIVDETGGSVLQELTPGAVLGELALIVDSPRTASARARRDARLLRVGQAEFESVLEGSASVSRALLRTLGDWLTTNRGAEQVRPPVTIAVVALDHGAAAAGLDMALATELGRFGRVHHVTRDVIEDESDMGHELSGLLDRIEPAQGHVVLDGGLLGAPDAWTEACLRQADRVLLAVDVAPAGDERRGWSVPVGADDVLLGAPGAAGIGELLDELAPRATMRVRPGAERREDIAVIARRLAGRSVGLVLSGGGARCFSQIGVIQELQAAGVRIDRIGGTSMGSFIGALAAQGLDHEEIDARCYEEFVRRNPLNDYRFPRTSLVRGKRARAMLERNLPGAIEDLPRGYFCVSVDLIAAQTFRHRRGVLAEAVGASMSLPIFAPPVVQGGRLLLDGALMDNLPTEAMASEAEGPIIAVDATEPSLRSLPDGVEPTVPTLMETIYKVMLLSESDSERRQSFADVLIRPDYDGIGILEFHMLDRMREEGRRAALEALERAPASVFG